MTDELTADPHAPGQLLGQAAAWLAEGRGVALATVVRTWGSSPRPPGSQLVIRDDGLFVGSVSGGCVEGQVISEALELLASDASASQTRRLEFGVRDEQAWEVGLACGGRVEIFVELVT
jgi:xanthine/CO dehydrogenase XdhC/CoxF family maturation factor